MKPLLVGFGDSWTFGSELDRPQEQNWLAYLGRRLDADTINMGTPASSIGHLIVQLFDFMKQYNPDRKTIFMVGLSGQSRYLSYDSIEDEFVNVTPEAVYRTTDIHPSGKPPAVAVNMKPVFDVYYRYIDNCTYREFNSTSVIFAFQNYCLQHNISVLFFSYFDKLFIYKKILNDKNILSDTMTFMLTGQDYILPTILEHKYFKGKLFHPNIEGHERMAEILHDHYVQTYGTA